MSVRILQLLWRDSEGSALIEGALVVPILCTLVFGVFEFSWLFYQQHLISTGIRDAARYIARTSNPNDITIQTGAKNLATTGAIDGNTARVSGWWTHDVNITYASVDNPVGVDGLTPFRGGAVIRSVTVSTTFAVPSLGFFGFLGLKPPAFTVSHQERVTGPG
jgi:Flp pilus assembly protein TadG